ncbi:MAG: aminopeptidase N, partial [Planctomycetaceae bacterium]
MTISQTVQVVQRSDYRPPAWWIDNVALEFDLDPTHTLVTARIEVRRNEGQPPHPLELAGEHLQLQTVVIDGKELSANQYSVTDELLVLADLPDECVIETQVIVSPVTNKALTGLYQTSGNYCTQCEAMGFRRITYCLDLPGVMAT